MASFTKSVGGSPTNTAIGAHDPKCRGVVLLGLDAPEADLVRSFAVAAGSRQVKGSAVGRTIFADAAAWLAGGPERR